MESHHGCDDVYADDPRKIGSQHRTVEHSPWAEPQVVFPSADRTSWVAIPGEVSAEFGRWSGHFSRLFSCF